MFVPKLANKETTALFKHRRSDNANQAGLIVVNDRAYLCVCVCLYVCVELVLSHPMIVMCADPRIRVNNLKQPENLS